MRLWLRNALYGSQVVSSVLNPREVLPSPASWHPWRYEKPAPEPVIPWQFDPKAQHPAVAPIKARRA